MNDTEKVINKVLLSGEDDWVMMAEVTSIIMSVEGFGIDEEEKIRNEALRIIRLVVRDGLMTIGDVTKEGFRQWDLSGDDALREVEKRWKTLGRFPKLGDVCWLSNTKKGDEIARRIQKENKK
jgi:hypothetical protein